MDERQLGTAMWVIDVLALRVGNEKGEGEADTVGCCSLRVEHIKFKPDSLKMEMDFLACGGAWPGVMALLWTLLDASF